MARPVCLQCEACLARPVCLLCEACLARSVCLQCEACLARPVCLQCEACLARPVCFQCEACLARPVCLLCEACLARYVCLQCEACPAKPVCFSARPARRNLCVSIVRPAWRDMYVSSVKPAWRDLCVTSVRPARRDLCVTSVRPAWRDLCVTSVRPARRDMYVSSVKPAWRDLCVTSVRPARRDLCVTSVRPAWRDLCVTSAMHGRRDLYGSIVRPARRDLAVVVDATVPVAGHVYDVISDVQTKDVDYTTVESEIGAKWFGFYDLHSHVTGYSVSIGKCRQCDDILEKSHVGIATSIHVNHVTLERGVTYYTTVEACNGAGLCVAVTSDGIIADTSPPVAGDLFDGISAEDVDYQSSRSTISAHWLNFHDPESGLRVMEWRAGTAPGHSDLLAPTRLHVTARVTVTLTHPLPVGTKVYVTLKVFNKAGLWIESTSDGFIVDDTAPVTKRRIALDRRLGSLTHDTQVWMSSLSVRWEMSDPESSIVEQFVSLTTRDSIHHNVPAVKLYGDEHEYTFSNVSLVDGETYYAKVIACNGARLCTTSVSEGILVDSTPPVAGSFAVETDHAAALTRHRPGWMTYENNSLNLAWLGFSDAHSDVMTYYVSVGTKFGNLDKVPTDAPIMITHTTDDKHGDEGFVQKANISLTSPVQQNQQLYISLWAENKVGLVSSHLHGTFTAVPSQVTSGTLALVRRCQRVSCEGHCTCAPHGLLTCGRPSNCFNVNGKPGYKQLSVYDIEDYSLTPESNAVDIDFTRSLCALAATWRVAATPGKVPERYEWSVGVEGHTIGGNLLDVDKEPIWRDTGHAARAVYTTRSSRESVYMTDGVMTDSSPPELSRAAKVTEWRSPTSNSDVDFITSTSNVTLSWRGVFRDSQAAIQRYAASISKNFGGRDVAEKQLTSSVSQTTFDGLTLEANDVYYCTVVSYNEAGLIRSAYSDGFKVDMTAPVTGKVWDGRGLTDQDYSRNNRTVSAWWRGFSDGQSYIDHYAWCVGTRLYSTVYAVNGAGLKSATVSSDGVVIDSTPPLPVHKFQLGLNLLKNPSFEENTPQPGTKEAIPSEWTGQGTLHLTTSAGDVGAQDGPNVS
ncbi:hypothetical protein LSAT2_009684 [Lamellibrachia satsuma]|nr:hypothetical protein LSAT2_009684 [Lamellibrachia satsuma]